MGVGTDIDLCFCRVTATVLREAMKVNGGLKQLEAV